jgi:hypothetical protein
VQSYVTRLAQGDEYGYFPMLQPKNWAGTGGWQPVALKTRAPAGTTKTRKTKEKLTIDFASTVNWKTALATSRASTVMKEAADSSADVNQLPDDVHFKAENFACLFMKPKVKVSQSMSVNCVSSFQAHQGSHQDGSRLWYVDKHDLKSTIRFTSPAPRHPSSGADSWYNYDNPNDRNNFCAGRALEMLVCFVDYCFSPVRL